MTVNRSVPGVKALMEIGCGKRLGWGEDSLGRSVYCRVDHPCYSCQRRIAQLDMKKVLELVQELETNRRGLTEELNEARLVIEMQQQSLEVQGNELQ